MKQIQLITSLRSMGIKAHFFKYAFFIALFVAASPAVFAGTKIWTGAVSTDWSLAGNYSPATVPVSSDDITIPTSPSGGRMPILTTGSFTISSLIVQSGATFTMSGGTILLNSGSFSISGIFNQTGGTILSAETLTISNGGVFNQSNGLLHMASTIGATPTDAISIAANAIFSQTGGTVAVKDMTVASGTPNGTYNQSGGTYRIYHDLKGSGNYIATGGTIQFSGDGGGGTFPSSFGTIQFFDILIDAGVNPNFDANAPLTIKVAGNITNNGAPTIDAKAIIFEFNGTGSQTISGNTIEFYHVTVNKASGSVSLAANQTVKGNLTVTAGTFDLSTYTINRTSSGGVLTVSNGGTLSLGGTTGGQAGSNFPLNYSTLTLATGSTVNYSAGNSTQQSIHPVTYSNLSLSNVSGTGTSTKITTANLTVNGNLTIGSDATLAPGAAFTVGGSGTLTGAGIAQVTRTIATPDFLSQYTISNKAISALTVDYNASAAQTVNALNYGSLKISGNRTTSNVTLPSSGNVGIAGSFSPVASFTTGNYITIGSTIDFNGNNDQVIPVFNYVNLLASGNGSVKSAAGLIDLNNALTIGSGVTIDMGINVLSSSLTLTNNGNIRTQNTSANPIPAGRTWPGSVEYNAASGGQTIVNGNYATLKINTAAGNNAIDGNIMVSTDLNLSSGTLAVGTNTLTISNTVTRTAGAIDASNGTVVFNGTATQVLPANTFSGNIKNLTVDNAANVVINSSRTISNALHINQGALDLNGNTITLGGTLSGSGKLKGSATSGLTIASTAPALGAINLDQTTDGASNALANLSVTAGAATLGNKTHIFNTLDVSAGSLDLAGKNVVIRSTATNTGRVAPVTGTFTNATNVTVERYFPNDGRRYRLFTPGVNATGSIRTNWMEGAMNTNFWGGNINPNPGYGTHITGPGGNANGFDVTTTNGASLYTFNQATGGWSTVTNTNATPDVNKSYLIFIRGDRSVDMTINGAPLTLAGSATTLRTTGTLTIGTKNYGSLASNGAYSLMSNPYASPISWTTMHGNNSSNFENYYTYWEPKSGSRGAYVTVTTSGLKSNPSVNATVEIQSGQAFFVKTKNGVSSPSLTVREQDKSTSSNINVFRAGTQTEQLYASLFTTDAGTGQRFNLDGVLTAYNNNYATAVDGNDALQIANWDEDVAIVRENKSLSIETRPLIDGPDTMYLAIARLKVQDYEWQFDPSSFTAGNMQAFLKDNFTGSSTAISLTSPTIVNFTVTTNAASSAANRFMIVFQPAATLPVKFTAVSAYEQGKNVKVEWHTTIENNTEKYTVERSTDGRNFTAIADEAAKKQNKNVYVVTDATSAKGIIYYRIRATESNAGFKYSNVVAVKIAAVQSEVDVYPNPLTGNNFSLQLASMPKGKYVIALYNAGGQLVMQDAIDHQGGSGAQTFELDKALSNGIYQLKMTGEGREINIKISK